MQQSFIIVDDFYPDPDAVRARALGLAYAPAKPGSDYGFNGLLARTSARAKKALLRRMLPLMGGQLEYDLRQQGDFRCLPRRQFARKKSYVHYDLHDWSGVLSLSPPRKTRSFTTFWHHRRLGLHGLHDLDRVSAVCSRHGLTLSDLAGQIDAESRAMDVWEETSRVEHAFNRLILFRGNMFHSASDGFGTRVDNSKLTQTFFFDVKAA